MSIDELGAAAATAARQRAVETVSPAASLTRLHRTRRLRTVTSALGVAASVALIAVAGTAVFDVGSDNSHATQPGGTVPPTLTGRQALCADPLITCLSQRRFRVALDVPITLTRPGNFQEDLAIFGEGTLESYRSDYGQTGVTVFERATPVKNGPSWTPDPRAGTTAHSMATWLQHRPFLTHTTLRQVRVGDLTGWRVTGVLRSGTELRADKGAFYVAPTFSGGGGNAGYGSPLTGDYTLVDVPGAGVTVIWSWTMQPDRKALVGNQAFIDGLSFG